MKPLIYAVEDDPALRELYELSLENEFECTCLNDGDELYAALRARLPDLIILDIMLPGDDGFAILSKLKSRETSADIPVIMVSAKNEEIAKVKGLNTGADDYISKPFGVLELIARIKANLRKYARPAANPSFKDIQVDTAKYQVTVKGVALKMTNKEYKLLSLLCEQAGRVQSRDTIFAKVWGEDYFGETRTLDIHIKELRRKLKNAASEAVIETVRGVGYMLT